MNDLFMLSNPVLIVHSGTMMRAWSRIEGRILRPRMFLEIRDPGGWIGVIDELDPINQHLTEFLKNVVDKDSR